MVFLPEFASAMSELSCSVSISGKGENCTISPRPNRMVPTIEYGKIKFIKLAERNRYRHSVIRQGASLYKGAQAMEMDHSARDLLHPVVRCGYLFLLYLQRTVNSGC